MKREFNHTNAAEIRAAFLALMRVVKRATSIDQVRDGAVYARAELVAEQAKGRREAVPWSGFVEAGIPNGLMTEVVKQAELRGLNADRAVAEMLAMNREERLFVNSRYQVNVRKSGENGVHLSIKRIDQEPIHDWRDLQRIKNALVGPECEAVELYPAESRRVDTANQTHLWAINDPTFRFPLGFGDRLVDDIPDGGHYQRPFEDEADKGEQG